MKYFYITLIFLYSAVCFAEDNNSDKEKQIITHADAAVILAKCSGLFDRYVAEDASLTECVSFLNKNGIYFELMEVVGGSGFRAKDAARVLGQIKLVLSGEAEYFAGKVVLPPEMDTWEHFCVMNNIGYKEAFLVMQKVAHGASKRN